MKYIEDRDQFIDSMIFNNFAFFYKFLKFNYIFFNFYILS